MFNFKNATLAQSIFMLCNTTFSIRSLWAWSLTMIDSCTHELLMDVDRFHYWGLSRPNRPVEDIAYATARFFQNGGSYMNYYMVRKWDSIVSTPWHGRPFRTTNYSTSSVDGLCFTLKSRRIRSIKCPSQTLNPSTTNTNLPTSSVDGSVLFLWISFSVHYKVLDPLNVSHEP